MNQDSLYPNQILYRREIAPAIFELRVYTPFLARKARPGEFVLVMADPRGERIPLTIADFDRQAGNITLVVMAIGTSTRKITSLLPGQTLSACIGPLGVASEIENYGTVVMVAGGVGAAPIYPIARALREAGNRVITVQGARNKHLLFWTDRLADVSDQIIVTTDDGSFGRKGLVTEPLVEILRQQPDVRRVYAIGPTPMMKFCALATAPFNVRTIVSLNTIMIDGTGMCGGCRVMVGDKTLFTCVDGPEFDGHLVNWDLLLSRQKIYAREEQCSLERYLQQMEAR
ncbi:sulfide/dihydroorotate dehydrogenase-like FAD/NAD-binding protein [bacterium]|nr:sulfide/dihydroorotate dehydrogenase-like FAD/NAD-binding protein [bacterium]